MKIDHFTLAEKLNVDHGEAVVDARKFCPSGYGTGDHGSLCPCDNCVTEAVLVLGGVSTQRGAIA